MFTAAWSRAIQLTCSRRAQLEGEARRAQAICTKDWPFLFSLELSGVHNNQILPNILP